MKIIALNFLRNIYEQIGLQEGNQRIEIPPDILEIAMTRWKNVHDYEIFPNSIWKHFIRRKRITGRLHLTITKYILYTRLNFLFCLHILILFFTFQDEFIRFLQSRDATVILQSKPYRVRAKVYRAVRKDSNKGQWCKHPLKIWIGASSHCKW